MDKIHEKSTLMGYKKEQLVNHCMALEHNNRVLTEQFEIQYKNCVSMVNDMNLLNGIYKNVKSGNFSSTELLESEGK